MLDIEIAEQLKNFFLKLENPVVLQLEPSNHEDQPKLREMLEDLSRLSQKVLIQLKDKVKSHKRNSFSQQVDEKKK